MGVYIGLVFTPIYNLFNWKWVCGRVCRLPNLFSEAGALP